jgi:hypothetical protein
MGTGDWIAIGGGAAVWIAFIAGLHKMLIGVSVFG